MKPFLAHFGYGLLGALVGGVAAYFGDPAHYVELGVFAGAVTLASKAIATALQKFVDKYNIGI